MTSQSSSLQLIQQKIWSGHLPLQISLSHSESRVYDRTDPYLISFPRLSYLPLLLHRLHAFFLPSLIDPASSEHNGWFSYEGVPLKWHIPIGLLYDLYSPDERELPFRLTIHFTSFPSDQLVILDAELRILHDAFMNSVKEADFVRNGTAKGIMSLSKDDSTGLWKAVMEPDLQTFTRISTLLHPPLNSHFRNIPLRIYIPSSPSTLTSSNPDPISSISPPADETPSTSPSLKIIQSPIPPLAQSNTQRSKLQTLGTALHTLLPTLFPSRSRTHLAVPVLHGAVLPMGAILEDVARYGAYCDGWVGIVVRMA